MSAQATFEDRKRAAKAAAERISGPAGFQGLRVTPGLTSLFGQKSKYILY